jgi:hypothetical protein
VGAIEQAERLAGVAEGGVSVAVDKISKTFVANLVEGSSSGASVDPAIDAPAEPGRRQGEPLRRSGRGVGLRAGGRAGR